MALLKINTTYNRVFYLASSTGVPVTGAVSGMTIKISKAGASFANPVGTVTEVGLGFYYLQANTADVNTLGDLAISVTSSSGSPTTPVAFAAVDQVVSEIPGGAQTLTTPYDFAKGTVAIAESYAANGAAPTPIQALLAIHQMLMQFQISGTSVNVKKLDNVTAAFTATLDSATAPTRVSRT